MINKSDFELGLSIKSYFCCGSPLPYLFIKFTWGCDRCEYYLRSLRWWILNFFRLWCCFFRLWCIFFRLCCTLFRLWCSFFRLCCTFFRLWCCFFRLWCRFFRLWCRFFRLWCTFFRLWCCFFRLWCSFFRLWRSFFWWRLDCLFTADCFICLVCLVCFICFLKYSITTFLFSIMPFIKFFNPAIYLLFDNKFL